MNIGIIYKVKLEKGKAQRKEVLRYFIKLERNVEIEGKEYNICITDIKSPNPQATLISVEKDYTSNINLESFFGKKLNFEIDLNSYAITSIEYSADEK